MIKIVKKRYFFLAVILLIAVVSFSAYFLFFTVDGAGFVLRPLFSFCGVAREYAIGRMEGSLAGQLTLRDLEVRKAPWLPSGSWLKIQKLDVYLTRWDLRSLNVEIHNGQFFLPRSPEIFFDGITQDGILDFNVSSKNVDICDLLAFFPKTEKNKEFSGTLKDFKCLVKGSYRKPSLKGSFFLQVAADNNFSLQDCTGTFLLKSRLLKGCLKLKGDVVLEGGIACFKNARVELESGTASFSGDLRKPFLDLKAKIEAAKPPPASAENDPATVQKNGIACKVKENLSVEGEAERNSEKKLSDQSQEQPRKDAVFLKYNQKF